jgi:hypothetical protein
LLSLESYVLALVLADDAALWRPFVGGVLDAAGLAEITLHRAQDNKGETPLAREHRR